MAENEIAEAEKARLQAQYEKTVIAARASNEYNEASGSHHGTEAPAAWPSLALAGPAPMPASANAPPPYSGPAPGVHEASPQQSQQQQAMPWDDGSGGGRSGPATGPAKHPGLPALDYRLYVPPLFTLSADKTTLKTQAPHLSASATALAALVRAQAAVPPKPMVRVLGTSHGFVDFDLRLNLMSLLVPDDPRRQMNYLRCVAPHELAMRGGPSGKPSLLPTVEENDDDAEALPGSSNGGASVGSLDAWCQRFVDDQMPAKLFVLERQVVNMDLGWLEGQIRLLVATTNYKGELKVSFPVTHTHVAVQSPDRANKFLSSVTSLFSNTSTYEVVKAVWPFASQRTGRRTFAVQSEQSWWDEWRAPLRHAIALRRTGWVTNEDKLEVLMEGGGHVDALSVHWGNGDHGL